HCGWPSGQPAADSIHHPGDLYLLRQGRPRPARMARPPPRRLGRAGTGARRMNIARLFIQRRIATTLLALGLGLAGLVAYFLLSVLAFPNIAHTANTARAQIT